MHSIRNFYFGYQSTELKYLFPFFACLLFSISSLSQTTGKTSDTESFPVGYKNIITIDSGRLYKPGVSVTDKFYYRPIELDIWYPARDPQSISPVRYGEFLDLLEQRSNRFQDDTVFHSLSTNLVLYLGANLNITDTASIRNLKTKSLPDAKPIPQKFPLIIYMSSYNGMSYENISLFEKLAANGYVVASITSVGRYPGNMSTKKEDLMEQVWDGSFAICLLKSSNRIDPVNIGLVGYSWGGLAALILAMNQKDIGAVLSLDGSEMHYYGESQQEDNDFDSLRKSTSFQLTRLPVPYTYLESGFKLEEQQADSVFNIFPYFDGPKYYVRFPIANHEDFSYISSLPSVISHSNTNGLMTDSLVNQLSLNYFNQYLKNQGRPFTLQLDAIYSRHLGDSSFQNIHPAVKKMYLIKGKLVDLNSHEVLAYANIGVPDKNMGTVSRRDGSFEMPVSAEFLTDSLKISMIGYQSRVLSISNLIQTTKPLVIALERYTTSLQEVFVTQKKPVLKTLGNTTTSTFVSVGLPLKFLGSEIGVKINLGKNPVWLKSFAFNISSSRLDTAVFRLNIYNFKNGRSLREYTSKKYTGHRGKENGEIHHPIIRIQIAHERRYSDFPRVD